MKELCQSASLFEVNVPDYKQLKSCRKSVVRILLVVNVTKYSLFVSVVVVYIVCSYNTHVVFWCICTGIVCIQYLTNDAYLHCSCIEIML